MTVLVSIEVGQFGHGMEHLHGPYASALSERTKLHSDSSSAERNAVSSQHFEIALSIRVSILHGDYAEQVLKAMALWQRVCSGLKNRGTIGKRKGKHAGVKYGAAVGDCFYVASQ
jgi:hypothetical protein